MDEVFDARSRCDRRDEAALRVAATAAALGRLAADAMARGLSRDDVIAEATMHATQMRSAVGTLATHDEELACRLHDRALQLVEYVATDGYGANLSRARLVALAHRAATEAGRALRPAATGNSDLMTELRAATRDAGLLGLPQVQLSGAVRRDVSGADVEALSSAVHEALTNVRKHAGAGNVSVSVESRRRELRVIVCDDGVGADRAKLSRASGLGVRRSITGRMARRGGWSRIDSAPGAGTRVMLAVPMAEVA